MGEPFVPNGASRPTLTLLPEPRGRVDIDGDGAPETLVVLAESSGGSGTFHYLSIVKQEGRQYRSIDTVLLGDRVTIERISADDAYVRVELQAPDEGDVSCCPTGIEALRWQWIDGKLEPIERVAPELDNNKER